MVDELNQAAENLKSLAVRYRSLAGNLIYGICHCGLRGEFLDVNGALVKMLGYQARKEILGENLIRDVLSDPDQRARFLGRSGLGGHAEPLEMNWKAKDGKVLRVRVSGREIRSGQPTRNGYEMIVQDVTKDREREEMLLYQAVHDPLTGLANYRKLIEVLNYEIKRSRRSGREFALLMLDVDGLKRINDQFGHLTGSQSLCRVANALKATSRDVDTATRFGGDEFALVLPETGAKSVDLIVRRLNEQLANDGGKPDLSVSVGASVYPKDGQSMETLLRSADASLYAMKAEKVIVHSSVA